MQDTNPRTELHDAILASLSENVDDDAMLTAIETEALEAIREASTTGQKMVNFDTYMAL